MATASVTLSLNQSAFLAGMARARSAVSGLGASAAGIAGAGIAAASVAIAALGTATAVGIKKAFDFGGKLADMSAISGKSVTNILLLRRALEDAGVSMEKIDRFILTGQDRGEVIARALKNMSEGDWADAAASVGKQAGILEKNAKTFDRVSDLLGRSGDKLRGFFVGAADSIGKALLPILERFDKMDFATQGQQFGDGLLKGARAVIGLFENPKVLTQGLEDAFTAAALGLGNVLLAVFRRAGDVLGTILYEAGKRALNPFASGSKSSLMDAVAENLSGSKLEVKDVFGAGAALANAQTQVSRSAELGKKLLPPEMAATAKVLSPEERAAAGQQKLAASYAAQDLIRSQIAVSSQSGGINESMFSKNAMASEDEFATRWGMPKPSDLAKAGGDKSEEHLAKIRENSNEQTEITREAWGKK